LIAGYQASHPLQKIEPAFLNGLIVQGWKDFSADPRSKEVVTKAFASTNTFPMIQICEATGPLLEKIRCLTKVKTRYHCCYQYYYSYCNQLLFLLLLLLNYG
jgi:hypothetical protein